MTVLTSRGEIPLTAGHCRLADGNRIGRVIKLITQPPHLRDTECIFIAQSIPTSLPTCSSTNTRRSHPLPTCWHGHEPIGKVFLHPSLPSVRAYDTSIECSAESKNSSEPSSDNWSSFTVPRPCSINASGDTSSRTIAKKSAKIRLNLSSPSCR